MLCIVVVAHPDESGLEKMNDGGEDFLSREPGKGHVLANLRADGWKSLGELHHMFVFGALADLTKKPMVAILLAPLGIAARGLDVTVRRRADPDVGPGGGMASDLMRLRTSASVSLEPSARE